MSPIDAVQTVIAAFDRVNLVALGERHWGREDAQFRQRLVQHPAFAQTVNDIVIEFGNPLHQTVLTRFVDGEDVPLSELRKVWQDTTQPGAWDSPVYEDFLMAVRGVNATLPAGRRLRVDWSAITGPDELPNLDERDRTAASIVDLLKQDARAKWLVVAPIGGPALPDSIMAIEASPDEPALINLASDGVGDLNAADVLERGTKRIKLVNGRPVFADGKPVFIPVFGSALKVRQLADSLLFFGGVAAEWVQPPAGLYDGTEYAREIQRRRKILTPW